MLALWDRYHRRRGETPYLSPDPVPASSE
jgi:hypothetical protein